jgi:ATP phosphoribosyltransferase regulatory subunit
MPQPGFPDFSDDLARALDACGTARVDIPVIQPAEPFLDMAGEDLRRRIFLTESETGESLCLRPEFTIPVCRAHIAENVATPRRYSYLGKVFRQRRDGENEFFQAGVEDLGEPGEAVSDARALSEARALVADFTHKTPLAITLGDQSVFEAVVAGLGLPAGWQKRLIHAFGNEQALDAMIARLAGPDLAADPDPSVAGFLKRGDVAGLENHITAVMQATGYSTHASRSPAEIAARLMDKQALDATRLAPASLEALKTFLALDVTLDRAAGTLSDFARDAGLRCQPGADALRRPARCTECARRGSVRDPLACRLRPSARLLHRAGLRDRSGRGRSRTRRRRPL